MNNYEIQRRTAAKAFAAFDTAALARRFDLKHDDNYIYLNFLATPYCICRKTGLVTEQRTGLDAGFDISMTIYDMLTNPNGMPCLSGQWCSHEHFNAVRGGTLQGKLELHTDMSYLVGRVPLLRKACHELGGVDFPSGDYAAVLPLFDFFPVLLRYYDADEEFPAQLQILWDANTTRYLRYETTFFAAGAILRTVKSGTSA